MDDTADRKPRSTPVLVVGDCDRAEMSAVHSWLEQLGSEADVWHASTLLAADRSADESWSPALVIVCQSWPDELSANDVAESLGRWPLAQWVCCYGRWCDSDGRTRTIWPISVRVPISDAIQRLNRVWNVIHRSNATPLPLTASRDETFAFDHCG